MNMIANNKVIKIKNVSIIKKNVIARMQVVDFVNTIYENILFVWR
jgi:hypothetical protein